MKVGEKRRTPRKTAHKQFISVPVLLSDIACPVCGCDEEVWAGDREVICTWCGHRIVRMTTSVH